MTTPVCIITDSASDLSVAEAKELAVEVLPMKTIFSDGEYRDGVDLTPDAFYEKLIETGEMPSTSQITPISFSCAFREALAQDQDIVVVSISSKLSGSLQSAEIARDDLPEEERRRIHIVDTLNVTIGEQLLVRLAVQLRDQGASAAGIAAEIERERDNIRIMALLDTLEYLKKGGRISASAAAVGSLLSIKPVICAQDGVIQMLGKARGSKNGQNLLVQSVKKCGGIDTAKPFRIAYSGLSTKLLCKYWNDNRYLYEGWQGEPPVSQLGAVIGTHAGPGAIAVAFFAK